MNLAYLSTPEPTPIIKIAKGLPVFWVNLWLWLFADGFASTLHTSTAKGHWQKVGKFQKTRFDFVINTSTLYIANNRGSHHRWKVLEYISYIVRLNFSFESSRPLKLLEKEEFSWKYWKSPKLQFMLARLNRNGFYW